MIIKKTISVLPNYRGQGQLNDARFVLLLTVGGFASCFFQSSLNILVKLDHFPQVGMKNKPHFSNHHLVSY